ncbi:DUF5712 family protein [Chryseobacterium indologenes]|uniref:DUF5712 family protein n=1 Tax=Chryseobacterium indologenes TaxID=253 RepID=UPI0010245869|nr:DUF5712 family protein [Chryseobacterium indologenes]VFA44286.1 Uncharacterised protein [Chryseobacterium indologenes]
MNIKIQGGENGKYSNSGSSTNLVNYLEHEDMERLKDGKAIEHFFSHDHDKVSSAEVIEAIDNNKQKLMKEDAKFFVITVSPSEKELQQIGKTPQERSDALKNYIRNEVMQKYAENFGKGLQAKDIMYYGKVHHERNMKNEIDMHVHIVVSRKSLDKKMKLSPMTNHRNTTKGQVKGGFDRKNFIQKSEEAFDTKFGFQRNYKQSFEYCNSMKNGTLQDRRNAIEKAIKQESSKKIEIKKAIEQTKKTNQGLSL